MFHASIYLTAHRSSRCNPKKCGGVKVFDKNACACVCPAEKNQNFCSKYNYWNDDSCSCDCYYSDRSPNWSCGPNRIWSKSKCDCVCKNPPANGCVFGAFNSTSCSCPDAPTTTAAPTAESAIKEASQILSNSAAAITSAKASSQSATNSAVGNLQTLMEENSNMPAEDSQLIQEIIAFLQALLSSSQPTNDNTPARRKRQTSTSCPTLLQSIEDSRLVINQYQSELTATIHTIDLFNDHITKVTSRLIATTDPHLFSAYKILLIDLNKVSSFNTASMNTIQNSMLNIVQNLNTLQAQYISNNCDVSALMVFDCHDSEQIRLVQSSKCVKSGGMFVLETCSCAL
jgi:hypothetical protein